MAWILFFFSAAVIVASATKLSEYADIIALRTGLSGMFIGALLLAGATSLPELLSAINSVFQDVPNLAAGSVFGSNMFNMFMLAILDLIYQRARVLRRVAMNHALTAGLAVLIIGLAVFFIMLDEFQLQIGWVGVDSLILIGIYLGGVYLFQSQGTHRSPEVLDDSSQIPSLRRALLGFSLSTAVLVLSAPVLISTAVDIAEMTGLGTGFIGASLLAVITSLPELVATIAAVRLGAFDLAVGNLFGSNLFNMFALGITDFFYTGGRFLDVIDPRFAIAGMFGLILTIMGLIGNVARVMRRLLFLEIDALLILIVYLLGLLYLYTQGIGM
jgi:cation:H+ antiporter